MSEELTAYEQQRLANIERNVAFLASLGLASVKPPATSKSKSRTTSEKELDGEYRERKKARVARKGSSSDPPARRSARVMNQPAPAIEVDSDDELYGVKKAAKKRQRDRQIRGGQVRGDGADKGGEEGEDDGEDRDLVRYDCFPHSCEEVDDFEFQVFLIVRRWRHATCNALGLEPYKIFQNRTVLEVVRRQRNDESFATQQDSLALSKQLIEVWGRQSQSLPGRTHPSLTPTDIDSDTELRLLRISLHHHRHHCVFVSQASVHQRSLFPEMSVRTGKLGATHTR